jgi:hypothetical protein
MGRSLRLEAKRKLNYSDIVRGGNNHCLKFILLVI